MDASTGRAHEIGIAQQSLPSAVCRQFVLSAEQWQAFQDALDQLVQHKPCVKKLLREPGAPGLGISRLAAPAAG